MWNGAALNLELFTSTDSRLYLRRWCVGVDRLNTNSSGSAEAAWAYCVIHLKPGLSGSTRYQSTVESFTTVMCVYRWWAIPPPPPSPFLPFFFCNGLPAEKIPGKKGPFFYFRYGPNGMRTRGNLLNDQRRATRRSYLDVQHLLGATSKGGDSQNFRYPFFPSENFLLKRRKYDGHIS